MHPGIGRWMAPGAAVLLLGIAACGPRPAPADLVLRNGTIATEDSIHPSVQALAVTGDTIVAVGSDAEIGRYVGSATRVIDLNGALAVPGFIEGHGHFMGLGEAKMELDLTRARSWDEIVAMVADAAKRAKPGAWILGRGWHQEKWDRPPEPNIEGLPLGDQLAAASPANPVILTHASGHAVFVNRKALELAGIGARTPNPPGGEIVRDTRGRAIGMLRDQASGLVRRVRARAEANRTPEEVQQRMREQVRLAAADALAKGITTFQDQGESFATIAFLKQLASEGKLPLRLYVLVDGEPLDSLDAHLPEYRTVDFADGHFTVRAIGEVTMDGALGTHSAWFLEPYTDLPSSTGLAVTSPEDVRRIAELAIRDHYQLAVHAIGDRANREALDVFEAVFKEHPDARDLRWRIEHAQHLSAADIPRFGQLGVIASMQSVHACSDGPYVVKRLGEERAQTGAYVWHSLKTSGAVLIDGTDVPVEDEDPIANFSCAVTRTLKDGSAFYPAQRKTREEALHDYTLANAYAMFEEDRLGSLAPGKLADITVLSKNIMAGPVDEIPGTEVLYTVVGGRIAYQKQ
jgi:predicted amidohydrolase YtcJ